MISYEDSLELTRMELMDMAKMYRMAPTDFYDAGYEAAERKHDKKLLRFADYKKEKREASVKAAKMKIAGIATILGGFIFMLVTCIGDAFILALFFGLALICGSFDED